MFPEGDDLTDVGSPCRVEAEAAELLLTETAPEEVVTQPIDCFLHLLAANDITQCSGINDREGGDVTTNGGYLLRGEADRGSVGRSRRSGSSAGDDVGGARCWFWFALGLAGQRQAAQHTQRHLPALWAQQLA